MAGDLDLYECYDFSPLQEAFSRRLFFRTPVRRAMFFGYDTCEHTRSILRSSERERSMYHLSLKSLGTLSFPEILIPWGFTFLKKSWHHDIPRD